jgi:hypothetical protein
LNKKITIAIDGFFHPQEKYLSQQPAHNLGYVYGTLDGCVVAQFALFSGF